MRPRGSAASHFYAGGSTAWDLPGHDAWGRYAKHRHGALYIGVTNNLIRRIYEHREGLVRGFTKHYGIKRLVYFEQHATIASAIQREKTMKHWPRDWKIRTIEKLNPTWADLYEEIYR